MRTGVLGGCSPYRVPFPAQGGLSPSWAYDPFSVIFKARSPAKSSSRCPWLVQHWLPSWDHLGASLVNYSESSYLFQLQRKSLLSGNLTSQNPKFRRWISQGGGFFQHTTPDCLELETNPHPVPFLVRVGEWGKRTCRQMHYCKLPQGTRKLLTWKQSRPFSTFLLINHPAPVWEVTLL